MQVSTQLQNYGLYLVQTLHKGVINPNRVNVETHSIEVFIQGTDAIARIGHLFQGDKLWIGQLMHLGHSSGPSKRQKRIVGPDQILSIQGHHVEQPQLIKRLKPIHPQI